MESIYEYIANDSKVYAKRYIKSLISSTDKLKIIPECGRKVPEFDNPAFKEIFYRNHRIVYKLSDNARHIEILAVVHGAQDMHMFFNAE